MIWLSRLLLILLVVWLVRLLVRTLSPTRRGPNTESRHAAAESPPDRSFPAGEIRDAEFEEVADAEEEDRP